MKRAGFSSSSLTSLPAVLPTIDEDRELVHDDDAARGDSSAGEEWGWFPTSMEDLPAVVNHESVGQLQVDEVAPPVFPPTPRTMARRDFNILDLEPRHALANEDILAASFMARMNAALPAARRAFLKGFRAGLAFKLLPVIVDAVIVREYVFLMSKLLRALRFAAFIGSSTSCFSLFAHATRVNTPYRPLLGSLLLTANLTLASPRNRMPISLFVASRALETLVTLLTTVHASKSGGAQGTHDDDVAGASLAKIWIFSLSFSRIWYLYATGAHDLLPDVVLNMLRRIAPLVDAPAVGKALSTKGLDVDAAVIETALYGASRSSLPKAFLTDLATASFKSTYELTALPSIVSPATLFFYHIEGFSKKKLILGLLQILAQQAATIGVSVSTAKLLTVLFAKTMRKPTPRVAVWAGILASVLSFNAVLLSNRHDGKPPMVGESATNYTLALFEQAAASLGMPSRASFGIFGASIFVILSTAMSSRQDAVGVVLRELLSQSLR